MLSIMEKNHQLLSRRSLDVVYTHPSTGGKVYIGNLTAAQDLQTLKAEDITRVV